MIGREPSERVWVKSSYSPNDNDACVEVVDEGARVRVRDSKRREGPVLVFRRTAWCGLLAALENPAADRF
ncbi:DUF397 domain-containing protein [Streptomyces colonosanans]|uniref:DUF397 domain-containing protein n=1 Tax=Streptomyces colonosanans TaxID=1428652 RepID=A0A1S2P138_9ACTN|nr:DUF397 domain-containing protein [Streptomyces colonosanans]OIJ87212.1 DUF397 domain-containing protein [Streptomyces colonosanans]